MTDIDVAAVLALAQAARRNDGVAPLSEAFLLDLRSPHPRSTHLTAQIDGELAGYGQEIGLGIPAEPLFRSPETCGSGPWPPVPPPSGPMVACPRRPPLRAGWA